jgi:N-acetylglucosamine-6-sulfatase
LPTIPDALGFLYPLAPSRDAKTAGNGRILKRPTPGMQQKGIGMDIGLRTVVLLSLSAWPVAAQEPAQPASAGGERPNIVFVLTDDESLQIHGSMQHVKSLIEDEGTVFENAFVTYPICCPSRASILRGQYPHNTGVVGNRPPFGGFDTFRALGKEDSTVATWLQDAGYLTAFYGKYMNGYTESDSPPPGWDEWHAANNDGYLHYGYTLNENGRQVKYGSAPEDYITDVLRDKAVAHIRRFSEEDRPFFLHISTFSPHSPYVPAPRHEDMFAGAELPRPASFNEADVSDKPEFLESLPALTDAEIDEITGTHRARLASLQAIDEMVERLVGVLEETGELDNTYIVYTSDHGFHLGQHRLKAGKDTAYEEDIRVPLAVRGPGVPRGARVQGMVLNNDLAPTFADIAGATPPDFVDGRSFLPLLQQDNPDWRGSFLVRRVGVEADSRLTAASAMALRTPRWTFVTYSNGAQELYDLEADPGQLENLIDTADWALLGRLTQRIIQLKECEGEACRKAERPLVPDV